MELKRIITEQEERLLRLVHHDFCGLGLDDVAVEMNMSVDEVKRTLSKIEKTIPQLFPILTPQHRAILYMYDQHVSRKAIVEALNISEQKLSREVTFLREHGFLWSRKMNQYDPSLDGDVKERF